jgi:hypothetical protein
MEMTHRISGNPAPFDENPAFFHALRIQLPLRLMMAAGFGMGFACAYFATSFAKRTSGACEQPGDPL